MRTKLMYGEYQSLLAELRELLERRGAKVPEVTDDLNTLEPDMVMIMAMIEDRVPTGGDGLWVRIVNALYLTLHNPAATRGQQIAVLGLLLHVYTRNPVVAKNHVDEFASIIRALHVMILQEVLDEKNASGLLTYVPDGLRPDKSKPPTE